MEIIDINELAQLIRKSPKTIASDLARNPERIPPFFKLPGCKKPLWYAETVAAFIRKSAAQCNALPCEKEEAK